MKKVLSNEIGLESSIRHFFLPETFAELGQNLSGKLDPNLLGYDVTLVANVWKYERRGLFLCSIYTKKGIYINI